MARWMSRALLPCIERNLRLGSRRLRRRSWSLDRRALRRWRDL